VIGGQGEGTAREFRRRIATTVEADWSDVVEVFVDARDTNVTTELDARGDAALVEGSPQSGLSLELAETGPFRYGVAVNVGDTVTTRLIPGAPAITDVLRDVTLKWTVDNGLTVTPVIGERADDPNQIFGKAVASIARAVRNINSRS
jgi:Siphovirus ReqiPepy6 Gp37-like protein